MFLTGCRTVTALSNSLVQKGLYFLTDHLGIDDFAALRMALVMYSFPQLSSNMVIVVISKSVSSSPLNIRGNTLRDRPVSRSNWLQQLLCSLRRITKMPTLS